MPTCWPTSPAGSPPALRTRRSRRTAFLDTRRDGPQTGYTGAQPAAGQTFELVVAGVGNVPGDASTVVLTVTGVGATAPGYITVWPCGTERPLASSLNLVPNLVSSNAVVTRPGAGGKVCLYTQSGADLLVDVTGYVR